MRRAILLAATLAASGAAAAEPGVEDFEAVTVASMARLCAADQGTEIGKYAVGFCYGWIEGVEQFYAALLGDERFDVKPVACPGRVVTREETRKIFIDWATANPDAGNLEPLDGIVRAVRATFPCN
ncbi:MAG: Rap1a/Tai family immunity protein [Thermohalobaculum sp.]|nr:Rap1a/Tai family immunity protein [Thermohalobaculum sp.]